MTERQILDNIQKYKLNGFETDPMRIDDVNGDGSLVYIGYCERPGTLNTEAKWKLKKVVVAGTVTTITYAEGNTSFNFVWDNRTSYNYL